MLILAVSTTAVLGLPDGAPGAACTNGLMPTGHTNPANMAGNDSFPYNVNISNIGGNYIPGANYTSECALRYYIAALNIACITVIK